MIRHLLMSWFYFVKLSSVILSSYAQAKAIKVLLPRNYVEVNWGSFITKKRCALPQSCSISLPRKYVDVSWGVSFTCWCYRTLLKLIRKLHLHKSSVYDAFMWKLVSWRVSFWQKNCSFLPSFCGTWGNHKPLPICVSANNVCGS